MLAASDFDALRVKAVIFDVDGTLADTERDGQKWLRKTEQWNKWKLWASRWTEDGLASRSYR